jgi:ACS family sodium-dependent inorganic phosphate cotransporter
VIFLIDFFINKLKYNKLLQKLNWNEQETGMVLSALYWSSWITELPGGLVAQRFGGCRVLSFGVLLAGLLNLAFPLACRVHYGAAAILRAMQGLALVCN